MLQLKKDPYFYLFPLGLISASIGILIWIAYQLGLLNIYPREAHAALMFFSFLGAFISGFLMTAIPKMTKTDPASTTEILGAGIFMPAAWVMAYVNHIRLMILIYLLQLLYLLFFISRRFLVKKQIPFEGFVFMPFAFLLAFFGLGHYFLAAVNDLTLVYTLAGEAFVLNLICGLGSRLNPVLSRLPNALNPDMQGDKSRLLKFFTAALLLNTSFILQFTGYALLAFLCRAVVITVIAIYFFRIFHKPIVFTCVGWSLKLATGVMIFGYLIAAYNYHNPLASLHLVYIGGISLLTLMVATRVSLAHGGKSLDSELSAMPLLFVALFFMTAAFFRILAGIETQSWKMNIAEFSFLASIAIWAHTLIVARKN